MGPVLAGISGLYALCAAVFLMVTAPFTVGGDVPRNLSAARAMLDGTFGSTEGYLYSPVAAALTIPALAVPIVVATAGWVALKTGVVGLLTAWATRGHAPVDRFLAAIAALMFLPVVHDLALGNVTIVVVGAVALLAWQPDRARAGIVLGIVLATVPKPLLIPVLVWALVYRPRASVVGIAIGALALGLTAAVVGTEPFITWIDALRTPPILASGNLALSALPPAVAVVASVIVGLLTFVAIRRGPGPGLIAALACGLLVAPYTILYGASVLLVGVPVLVQLAPRATLALALLAPIGLIAAFPVWVGSFLLLALAIPPERWIEPSLAVRPYAGRVLQ